MPPRSLGQVIQQARTGRYKLREFARLLNVSPTHLSDVENNRRLPSEDLLLQFAQRLDLDFDRLMAMVGRVPQEARRLFEKHPEAVSLFRKVSTLDPADLKKLEETADDLVRKREQEG